MLLNMMNSVCEDSNLCQGRRRLRPIYNGHFEQLRLLACSKLFASLLVILLLKGVTILVIFLDVYTLSISNKKQQLNLTHSSRLFLFINKKKLGPSRRSMFEARLVTIIFRLALDELQQNRPQEMAAHLDHQVKTVVNLLLDDQPSPIIEYKQPIIYIYMPTQTW